MAEWLKVLDNWRKQTKYSKIKNHVKGLMDNGVNRKTAFEETFKAHSMGTFN